MATNTHLTPAISPTGLSPEDFDLTATKPKGGLAASAFLFAPISPASARDSESPLTGRAEASSDSVDSSDDSLPSQTKIPLIRGKTLGNPSPAPSEEAPARPALVRSRSVGDEPVLHDTLFNFVPGSCFEIGAALSVLSDPGVAGLRMDANAAELSAAIKRVYSDDAVGNQKVTFNKREMTLRQFFDMRILEPLRPKGDQIGRCPDKSLEENWYKGAGLEWLTRELERSSDHRDYTHHNMLTKIRTLSAFGSALQQLALVNGSSEMNPAHVNPIASVLGKSPETVEARYEEMARQLRHAGFDNPATRARVERAPIVEVDGRPVCLAGKLDVTANPAGLGFGLVYDERELGKWKDGTDQLRTNYIAALNSEAGRNGIPRQGQVMQDLTRPGIMTERTVELMPEAFQTAGLPDLLREKGMLHGTGVNRWMLIGSYPRESWDQDLPSAGAHSGGTVDILMGVNWLNGTSILGDREAVESAGILISSFMNYGGYHSFSETFPIVQAAAANRKFEVRVGAEQRGLYDHFRAAVHRLAGPEARERVGEFAEAYRQSSSPQASIAQARSASPAVDDTAPARTDSPAVVNADATPEG